MLRFKLIIEYDGTGFSGWQIQPDARTVEEELEKAFSRIVQQSIDLVGQGRTDAGVHAKGQVAHVDVPEGLDMDKLIIGVNGLTNDDVHIVSAEKVSDNFHARFDAQSREYVYTLAKSPSPLLSRYSWTLPKACNFSLMQECAALLNGEFDFSGFSKFNEENYTSLCTILVSEFEEMEYVIFYRIRANRFLRNMVRRLIGTMIQVALGKLSVADFERLLKEPGSDTKTYTAPAKGLVLEKVLY